MIKIIFSFLVFLFLIPYSYGANYECPYIENEPLCSGELNTCDGLEGSDSSCVWYSERRSGGCREREESCTIIREESSYIRFLNGSTGEVINTILGVSSNTPLGSGETGEAFANEFINDNIEVQLICNSCIPQRYESKIITENSSGEISLDYNGKTLSKKYRVWKIDKTPPVIDEIFYSPSNDTWSNGSKTATLIGRDDDSWLIGEDSPSYTCSTTGGCSGEELSITDSAGNISSVSISIEKIDRIPPTLNINLYAEIVNGKQKVGINCNDLGGSGCESYQSEEIEWITTGVTQSKCVYDNAGNNGCVTFSTSSSEADFSDLHLEWTSGTRMIYLECSDNHRGVVNSGCESSRVDRTIYRNIDDTTLVIRDNAGNTVTKHFTIVHIDSINPTITIDSPDEYKSSDTPRITVFVEDNESGVETVRYSWNSSCMRTFTRTTRTFLGTRTRTISYPDVSKEEIENGGNILYNNSGDNILYVCAVDEAGNFIEESKNIKIYPGDLSQDNSSISVSSNGDKYANNNDYYTYILNLKDKYGNSIYGKSTSEINFNYLPGDNRIYLDEVSGPGEFATVLYDSSNATNLSGETSFKVKSYTPGDFSQKFKIKMNNWGDDYSNNFNFTEIYLNITSSNTFLKPIIGSIEVIEGGDIPEIGIEQKYKILLNNTGSISNIINGNLSISSTTIKNTISGHFWDEFKDIDNDFGNNLNSYLGFIGLIGADDNILNTPVISSNNLEISYNIDGKGVRYYLDDFDSGTTCELETLGLKVIGNIQGDGKSDITGQEENFSDLTKLKFKTSIRKNAYTLIRNMDSGDILNGVRYVYGDVILNGDINGYETLIVTDGNVIISGDLNLSGNKLGIIVLKDNYNVLSDYSDKGNIYVSNNVENINAIIYSDGVFRSANEYGNSYSDLYLNKQLKLKGSLFTRNTIGGAVSAGGNYLLPGGKETSDFDLAEIYDLNYVRKVATDCSLGEENYSFLIEYDNSIINNPPKGFSN